MLIDLKSTGKPVMHAGLDVLAPLYAAKTDVGVQFTASSTSRVKRQIGSDPYLTFQIIM